MSYCYSDTTHTQTPLRHHSDRHHTFCVTIYWGGGCAGCTVYINQTGDEPQKQDTQADKRTPLLREEVPYQITLIRLRQWQGSCRVPQNK